MSEQSQRKHWIASHTADVLLLVLVIGVILILLFTVVP